MLTGTRHSVRLRVAYDVFLSAVSEEVARDRDANAVDIGHTVMRTFGERDCLVHGDGMLHGINAQRLRRM